MGCNCGKNRVPVPGVVPANPLILGEDNEELPVVRAMLLITASGARVGAVRYVRGSSVQEMIDDGQLRVVN